MTAHEPSDADARALAIGRPGTSLLLEAGAGTGKTTTMVGRMLEGIRQGIPLHKQVAITFTVKAAWELQTRLRTELIAANLDAMAEEIGRMRIGTIDAIVQDILEHFPVEAGLPGGFRIAGAQELQDRFEAWYVGQIPVWSADDALAEAWNTLAGLEIRLRTVDVTLRKVAALSASATGPTRLAGASFNLSSRLRSLEDAISEAEAMIPDGTLRGLAEQNIGTLREGAGRLRRDPVPELQKLVSMSTLGGKTAQPCRDAIKSCETSLGELRKGALFARVAPLLEVAIRDGETFSASLADEGLLSFDQALARCIGLFENPSVRAELGEQIASVMIDEFQDTSPAQLQLARRLCDKGGPPLFVVGDPKQSIYRFRGADLPGYLTFRELGGVLRAELLCNFRSHSPVLGLVNAVFRERFAAALGYRDLLVVCQSDGLLQGHAKLLGGECPSAVEARQSEAVAAVRAIQQALNEGWETWRAGAVGPLRPADIAVLYPRRKLLPELRAQLSAAGIPYRIEDRTSIEDSAELQAVVHVLRAAAVEESPLRLIARQAAARSLAFGVGVSGRVSEVEAEIDALVDRIRDRLPSEAVAEIVERLGIAEFAGGNPRPRATLNRIHALVDRALAAEAEQVTTLAGFVALLDGEDGGTIRESPAPETDEEAVRLMTVHAAKGLEFPMVVVVGFGGKPRPPDPIRRLGDGTLWVSIGSNDEKLEPPGRKAVNAAEIEAEKAETERLLYVAMTRAREHLVVSAYHPKSQNSLAKELHGTKLLAEYKQEPSPSAGSPPSSSTTSFKDTAEVLEGWKRVRQNDARTTPTRLAKASHSEDPDAEEPSEDGIVLSAAAKRSTAFGRSVHLALQELDFSSLNVAEVSASAATQYGFSPERVEAYVHRATESEPFREAARASHVLRELYAASLLPDGDATLLEGILDLVYERLDGTLAIVDYKTDHIHSEAEAHQRVAANYRAQGEAYADLVSHATGRRVSRVTFIFLATSPATVVEIQVDRR